MKVVMVCTGNICRSPFAEKYLQKRVKELGLDWEVSSSGLSAYPGNIATGEAVEAAPQFGVDLTDHRAQPATEEMLSQADLVLGMTSSHQLHMQSAMPKDQAGKIQLLGNYHQGSLDYPDIPDPIGGSLDTYLKCYSLIKECVEGLLHRFND